MDDLDSLLNDLGSASAAPTPGIPAPAGGGDDLDALLNGLSSTSVQPAVAAPQAASGGVDELDGLMASLSTTSTAAAPRAAQPVQQSGGDDLDDLLAGLGGGGAAAPAPTTLPASVQPKQPQGDDLDALLAGLDGAQAQPRQAQPQPQPVQSVGGGSDDLDALLAGLGGGGGAPAPAATRATVTHTAQPAPAAAAGADDLDSLLAGLGGGAPTATAARTATTTTTSTAPAPTPSSTNDLDSLLAGLGGAPPVAANTTTLSAPVSQPQQAATGDLDALLSGLGGGTAPVASTAPSAQPTAGGGGGGNLDTMLQNLQSDMGMLDPNQAQSGRVCGHCNQAIFGEVIQALGKNYHPEHFVCGNCQDPLGTRNFYEVGGAPQCERCYSNVGCPRCGYCNQPVLDRCITALNKKWHVEHFMCTKCLQPFPDGQFFEREGKPWCKNCFNGQFSYSCAHCNQAISGDVVNALGKHWHPNHFVCAYCSCSFAGGMFFERDGKPYCKQHYMMQSGATCSGCGQSIQGRVIEAFGKRYHPEHFVCGFCMQPLGGAGYTEHEGKPYCRQCSQRLF